MPKSHAEVNHQIDSLKALSRSIQSPSYLSKTYYDIADLYYQIDNDSSLHYGKQCLKQAQKAADTIDLANAHNNLGYIYDDLNDFDRSLHHFKEALNYFNALLDTAYIAECLHNIGYVISRSHNQALSLTYFLRSIELAEEINDTTTLSDGYSNLAGYYEYLENYETAKYYLNKSVEMEGHQDSPSTLASTLANLAYINLVLHQDSAAYANITEAEDLLVQIEDHYYLGLVYASFVDFFLELNDTEAAEHYINLTESLSLRSRNISLQAAVLKQKGDLAMLRASYWSAIALYNESLELYKSVNNPEQFSEIYKQKSAAYSKVGSYKKAHEALQQSNAFADSLHIEEIARLLGAFDQQQKNNIEQQNLKLQQELFQKKAEHQHLVTKTNLQLVSFALIFLVILTSLSVFFLLQIRKRNTVLKEKNQTIEQNELLLKKNIKILKAREKELHLVNQSKDKFFSIIAHDLKNPFNTLLGFSELLISNPAISKEDDFNQITKSIYNSAHSGYKLLENLLEWSRTEMGQIKYEPEMLKLEDILLQNIYQARQSAAIKDIKIRLIPNGSDEHHAFADRNMLNTVVRNLLSNAIKFSHKGKEVHVSVSSKDGEVVTSIIDFGVGMSQEEQADLFNQNMSVQNPGTNNETGTGLGLILCKEFIEKNSGKIWMQCKKDRGCTMNFSLPAHRSKLAHSSTKV